MKALDAALAAHLVSGATTLAWCWRLERADGLVMGFTDHDRPLNFGGLNYEPRAGLIPAELRSGSDLAVDAQDAEGALTSDRITEADIAGGLWDNASVEVWRVNWADPAQRALLRRGAIGQIRRGEVAFVAEMRSLAHVLGQTVGRTFRPDHGLALDDPRSGVDLNAPANRGTGAVGGVLRPRAFTATGLDAFTDGWFTSGMLHWQSGANAGRSAEVLRHDKGGVVQLTLAAAPLRPLASGDSFAVHVGSDGSLEDYVAKFGSAVNFRGFPHIPGHDAVMRYASGDGGHEGGVL